MKASRGDDDVVYKARGDAYMLTGAYDKAVSDYTRAIENSPEYSARSYKAQAEAYDKLGKTDLAAKDRKKASQTWGN
ncbi:MAG TPA: tetratricopeptide repeat protein [Chroococcales cyanobacterium]